MSAIHSDAEVLRLAVKCANSLATESHLVVTDAAESILYVPHALEGTSFGRGGCWGDAWDEPAVRMFADAFAVELCVCARVWFCLSSP
jgi:hypothetical protein